MLLFLIKYFTYFYFQCLVLLCALVHLPLKKTIASTWTIVKEFAIYLMYSSCCLYGSDAIKVPPTSILDLINALTMTPCSVQNYLRIINIIYIINAKHVQYSFICLKIFVEYRRKGYSNQFQHVKMYKFFEKIYHFLNQFHFLG